MPVGGDQHAQVLSERRHHDVQAASAQVDLPLRPRERDVEVGWTPPVAGPPPLIEVPEYACDKRQMSGQCPGADPGGNAAKNVKVLVRPTGREQAGSCDGPACSRRALEEK
ncbi:hypothetical protein GCM10022224_049840 [Nonomuraea antimicrobica]|uniref:Uncharacterized protein n=1 Tax=Nonomuraea antimicrobica TaxID=561173 RepID=A0ABP7C7U1_9ACTN